MCSFPTNQIADMLHDILQTAVSLLTSLEYLRTRITFKNSNEDIEKKLNANMKAFM